MTPLKNVAMHKAFYLFLTSIFAFSTFVSVIQPVKAQSPDLKLEIIATHPDDVIGVLERGELFVVALKREKIDANSIRLATQSISKLFDFRLSRAGDRYLYRLDKSRKITLLQYQRAQHIFEARLDKDGDYVSRIIDNQNETAKQRDDIVNPAPSLEDDEEIDVESLALGQEMQQAAPSPNENDLTVEREDSPDVVEFAPPDSPLQEEDLALAGRISPDLIETPPTPKRDTDTLAPIIHDLDDEDDEEDSDEESYGFGTHTKFNALNGAETQTPVLKLKSQQLNKNKVLSQVNTPYAPLINAVYALGALLFLLTAVIVLRRNLNVGYRLRLGQLKLEEKLSICDAQSLVMARYKERRYLLSVTKNKMAILDIFDDENTAIDRWKLVKAKTYWQQMAEKPMDDDKLFAAIKELEAQKRDDESVSDKAPSDDKDAPKPSDDKDTPKPSDDKDTPKPSDDAKPSDDKDTPKPSDDAKPSDDEDFSHDEI